MDNATFEKKYRCLDTLRVLTNSLMDGYEQINEQLSDERGFLNYLLTEITDRNDDQYTKDVLQLLATINLNAFKEG